MALPSHEAELQTGQGGTGTLGDESQGRTTPDRPNWGSQASSPVPLRMLGVVQSDRPRGAGDGAETCVCVGGDPVEIKHWTAPKNCGGSRWAKKILVWRFYGAGHSQAPGVSVLGLLPPEETRQGSRANQGGTTGSGEGGERVFSLLNADLCCHGWGRGVGKSRPAPRLACRPRRPVRRAPACPPSAPT